MKLFEVRDSGKYPCQVISIGGAMSSWDPKYSVGIQQLDAQHRELFCLIDELDLAIEHNEPLDIEYSIAKLGVYSLYHFVSEEHLMSKYGYPDLNEQLEKHELFKQKVSDFKANLHRDKISLAKEVREFLQGWISNHILTVDKKYSPFLSERIQAIPF